MEAKKQSKIAELQNLIAQYDAGERKNINADEYPAWVKILDLLKQGEITEDIFEDFIANPTHYKVEDGNIIYNDNWQLEAEQAELYRIANLHITKQDFYLQLCKPAGITFDMLEAKIAELNMKAEWNYCNHVYYGVIQPFLDTLPLGKTEEEIIAIFEKLTKD